VSSFASHAMTQITAGELTFEQAFQQLDRIVRELEDGEIGLEQALGQYEVGVGLLKRCYSRLQEAEQRIRILTGIDAEGKPVTAPFEHSATVNNVDSAAADPKPKRKKEVEPEVLF
jgi:exodeoxyribonuclease VII small subunit